MNKSLVLVAVLALAAVASADVRSTLRNNRQAIIVDPVRPGPSPFLVAARAEPAAPAAPSFLDFPQPRPFFRILRQSHEQDPAGSYRFSFETENGISAAEEGTVVRPGSSSESTAKQGSFSYTGPDGVLYSVSYIADDDGFRASGAHLPTPPPIPAAIQRSLELNARDGDRFDDSGFLKK